MAQLSKPPIPLKMYKHFAVATVSLTAGIAMFADADNRDAVATHVEEHEERARLQQASAEITTSPELIRRDQGNRGSFGEEAGISGAPTVTTQANNSGYAGPARSAGRISVAGYDQAYIDALSEDDYRIFLEAVPAASQRSGGDTASQRSAIEAASARRSGRRGPSTDAPD